ncbi:hypothetical protein CISIN_1g038365mg [Citrus sinensis]|uniref:Uncharacterized protein n=1 Tax=Citrus sinensis TaxID=2711 RepID=A0A067FXN4_CITSI|nr:hypothetical protein CISIN_1g038365mg [Citrus sinensis]
MVAGGQEFRMTEKQMVRHAQGLHNVDGDKNYKAYLSPEYFDAPVTQLGWQQGVHPCDKRRSISDYQFLFPAVDFSLIESDEDVLWKANVRETNEEVAARGLKFMNCMTGSDSSSTNYPGKIPSALDLPADIAERSHEKEDADTNSVDR